MEAQRDRDRRPESLCIPGGISSHNASELPSMVTQTPKAVTFLYFYSYYRLIPIDPRGWPREAGVSDKTIRGQNHSLVLQAALSFVGTIKKSAIPPKSP